MSLWETFRNQKHDYSTGRTPPTKRQQRQRKRLRQNEEKKQNQEKSSQSTRSTTAHNPLSHASISSHDRRRHKCYSSFLACHHILDDETSASNSSAREDHFLRDESHSKQRRRRTHRAQLGLSLAHQRLRQSHQKHARSDCYQDGSNVIYRKKEDYFGSQMYTSGIFLNDHDRVLAADVSGKIDIVQAPVFPHCTKYGGRPLGTVVLQELQIVGNAGSHPNQSTDASCALKLQSLDQGRHFVVGMPNGNYCLVDTERSKTTTTISSTNAQSKASKMIGIRRSPSANSAATTLTCQASLLPHLQAQTITGPRRKFHRDWSNPQLSLQQLVKNNGCNFLHAHNFRQVYGWDQDKPRVTTPISFGLSSSCRSTHANVSMWDFWESSFVLAAHVDAEHDCFDLWDSRQKPTVVINTSFAEQKVSHSFHDHVTSCAFVSQYCLATSHVTWNQSSYSSSVVEIMSNGSFQKKCTAKASSRIQLWDLRMLQAKRQPLSSMAILPSFPQDTVLGGSPNRSIPLSIESKQEDVPEASILQLQAPKSCSTVSGHSQLLVTTDSYKAGLQYHCLELAHGQITQSISSHGAGIMAASPSHHAMVCSTSNATGVSLQVYNLLEHRAPMRPSNLDAMSILSGTKRTHANQEQIRAGEPMNLDTAKGGISFTPVVKDRHGLDTQLSCLGMNYSGTSILGGSIDGDLFLWRGG